MLKISLFASAILAATVAVPGAAAQQTPAAVAKIVSVNGDFGSALVLRGSETFSLMEGDSLFEGDQIFTRTNGQVTISGFGCERGLGGRMSIVITPSSFCTVALNTLPASTTIGNTGLAIGGGVGATPGLLALLGAGLAGGAVASSLEDGQPASP